MTRAPLVILFVALLVVSVAGGVWIGLAILGR